MTPRLPVVLGNGLGGVVAEAGAGVDSSLVGTRVVTTTGGHGGYAQRCVVPADGRTALALTEAAALQPGETVLVEAAAGGVGSLLV